ncbi:right-handed parallel beta-helix repeat-containing protein [Shouchella shacheensis]|uniref:right-handed parallel beta-helix repeat-containing protein n=1 Tax=Shouchella shacheensis TaxID=1649580 RepID=UPI0007400730|nr:right-handed parallel beta-helix repeat-containing protein [Shouchella shacheensis]
MKTIRVSKKLLSKYKTIQQALSAASDGDTIQLEAGRYKESLVIDKSVALIGLEEPEEIMLKGYIRIIEQADVQLKNVTLEENPAGLILEEGHLVVSHCYFTKIKDYAIDVHDKGHLDLHDATIRHCGIGLRVSGRARVEYCALYGQTHTQIRVAKQGRLIVKHSHIYQGDEAAFRFDGNSRSLLENCQIYAHHHPDCSQLMVADTSEVYLRESTLYESTTGGITVTGGKCSLSKCKLTDNTPQQVYVAKGMAIIQNSLLEQAKTAVHVDDDGELFLERTVVSEHQDHQIVVENGTARLFQSTIKLGGKSGLSTSFESNVSIEACDVFGHHLPQVAASERAQLLMRHSAIYEGSHYGMWLTEAAKASVEHCRFFDNQLNQIVVVDKSYADLHDVTVYEGGQSGIYMLDESSAMITNSSVYRHHDHYPQIYIANDAAPTLRDCYIYDSYESGIRFQNKGQGLIEHCEFSGHFEAQVDIQSESTPTIRECIIRSGGTSALRMIDAGGFIENCSFEDHENNIIISGSCTAEIIGAEADALRQYEEAMETAAHEDEGDQLSKEEMELALQRAQEVAEREERTSEIVGLVEQLEERLGRKP